jgi:glycerophosphoryl diester phosphodiesterase
VVRALTVEELQRYDVGRIDPKSRYARRFPEQRPVDGARIPTLAEVVALTQRAGNDAVRLNLETKLEPEQPDLTAPPERFARLVVDEVRRLGIAGRTTIQSFDWRTLRAVQAIAREIPTVCLTAELHDLDTIARGRPGPSPWTAGLDIDAVGGSVPDLVAAAGCRVWSPHFENLHALTLAEAHSLGLTVVVWTVNDVTLMEGLIDGGVDGIITDYPDRLRDLMQRKGLPVPKATPAR